MTSTYADSTLHQLESAFGEGHEWVPKSGGPTAVAWETPAFHLLWCATAITDSQMRTLWEARKGRQAYSVVLLASSDEASRVRVSGPQDARPVRVLPDARVVELLTSAKDMAQREAAAFLAREFGRLEEAVVPGLRVKDLLTPHFLRDRLRWSVNQQRLSDAVDGLGSIRNVAWRTVLERMGYQVETLQPRGYLLRRENAPFAVVHAHADPSHFSRLTDKGELPEGMVLADAEKYGAQWGILVADRRFRIYQRRPPVGAATGQHVEIDTRELEPHNRFYIGLLAPDSLKENGWLTSWIGEAKDFGEELRRGLEERLIKDALPNIARGLGERLEKHGADLSDREVLRQIEEAALTLVFRFMFLLHTEARGYLPIGSAAYRPHSARQLAEDCRLDLSSISKNATQRWDRLRTLVRMVRSGDRSAGVPAYNGSLFAADGFPGGALLETTEITDVYLAPALAAIAFDTDKSDDPGLDYAGLQIGHLGAIYERLLALKLTRAPEDLIYDTEKNIFRAKRAGEQEEVTKAELFYQSEAGGRKAGGVYYTRHEFVDHLLNHSLLPALDDHLDEVRQVVNKNPSDAARRLFDFSVVDPAMGSAHFLTAALDRIADRMEIFLAEIGGLPGIDQLLKELDEDRQSVAQSTEHGDLLRRLILKRCIYGVDISPMAVEVANVTLWLASFVPGLALSYLGSNLKCGDALIGVADHSVVGAEGNVMVQRLDTQPVRDAMDRASDLQRQLAETPDRTPEEVKASERLGVELFEATAGLRSAFDLWAADPLGVDGARRMLENNAGDIVERKTNADVKGLKDQASLIAQRYGFFHWPLEFPGVFHRKRPGFDVVVGNPPWNKVKFEMLSFLALHDPGIQGLRSGVERDKRAGRLLQQRPELKQKIDDIKQQVEVQRNFYRPTNGYTIQGGGDTDLYKLFCERYRSISREQGFVGVVLPRSAFLNEGSRGFRRWLFTRNRPVRTDMLLNRGNWAFDMESRYTIALTIFQVAATSSGTLTMTGPSRSKAEFAVSVGGDGVRLNLADVARWTPPKSNDTVKEPSWELPLLPTEMHSRILNKLRNGVRFDQITKPSQDAVDLSEISASRHFLYTDLHSKSQRPIFNHPEGENRVPVWKGSSFDQYRPHGGNPAGYADPERVKQFLQEKRLKSNIFPGYLSQETLANPLTHPFYKARIAIGVVNSRTNSRSTVACLIPPQTPLTDRAPYLVFQEWNALEQASLLGIMNSLAFDWQARRFVETTLNNFILYLITCPTWRESNWQRIGSLASRLSSEDPRFADFAAEAGVDCGPLNDAERNDMRAEIDALVARAYGLTGDELRFIFTDFTENAVSPAYRQQVLEKFEAL